MIHKKSLVGSGMILAAALVFGSVAQAQEPTGSGPNPFRDCGIGAALFPTTNWAAVSSNVIWDVGTTAVTSATASPQTCQGQYVAAAAFIFETFDSLTEEAAKGSGEHIATLLNILNLNENERAAVLTSVRRDMASLVPQNSFDAMSKTEKAETFYLSVMGAIES